MNIVQDSHILIPDEPYLDKNIELKTSTVDENGNDEGLGETIDLREIKTILESDISIDPKKTNKPSPYSKNSKKSRKVSRGNAKKDGAGGKHTWGAPGSELISSELEDRDPNYDPENDDVKLVVLYPDLSKEELDKAVLDVIKEYLECGDVDEVITSLNEMGLHPNDINLHPRLKHTLVEMAVTVGMERHAPQREMISCLVSDATGKKYISQDHVKNGFDALLRNLNDLVLDTPDASEMLGKFIARAVADDALPPIFVKKYVGNLDIDCKYAITALRKAETLLSMPHGIVRLDNVWGEGGGNRPSVELKERIILLLKEFISSNDQQEAVRCLRELDVPHFHHEVVFQASMIVFQVPSAINLERMTTLIKYMVSSNIVTPDCLLRGLERLIYELPDIHLDCPGAGRVMQNILNNLNEVRIINQVLFDKLADQRARIHSDCSSGGLSCSN